VTGGPPQDKLRAVLITSTSSHQGKVGDGGAVRTSDVATLVVDDHATFRQALRDLVAVARGFVVVGEACSGEEAVSAVDRLSPRFVLMDVVMPGIGGIVATRMILNRHPNLVVVLISVDDPALQPGATTLGRSVACARKQDLRPDGLRRLWEKLRSVEPDPVPSPE
jgi:DNA-binding NarL/FixJ family response regulator